MRPTQVAINQIKQDELAEFVRKIVREELAKHDRRKSVGARVPYRR